MRLAMSNASSTFIAAPLSGCGIPILANNFPKCLRSSASSIDFGEVPIIGTPALSSSRAKFNGVCPPN